MRINATVRGLPSRGQNTCEVRPALRYAEARAQAPWSWPTRTRPRRRRDASRVFRAGTRATVQRQRKQEVGFRTIEAGVPTVDAPLEADFGVRQRC
jgi:hypothetical protein